MLFGIDDIRYKLYNMNNVKTLFFPIMLFAFISCQNIQQRANRTFVELYEYEDFSVFKDFYVWIRSCDNNKSCFVVICPNYSGECKDGSYVVEIDKESKEILDFNYRYLEDSINFDKKRYDNLAKKFISYNVNSINVDSNNNVYIKVFHTTVPTLIRFSEKQFISFNRNEKWRKITGLWYEKIE